MEEKTGTTYKCNNCINEWDYMETHCPECGSEDFTDYKIQLHFNCTCKDSSGWTDKPCCNDCGKQVEGK